jgi:hypothetical protein
MVGFNEKKLNYLQPKSVYECNLKCNHLKIVNGRTPAQFGQLEGKKNVLDGNQQIEQRSAIHSVGSVQYL